MIKQIFNLAVLNAFKVDPKDANYPICERLPGKRLALINWGPSSIKISFATKNGNTMEVAPEELYLPLSSTTEQVTDALKQRTDCNCVAVLYSAVNLFCEAQNGARTEPGEPLERRLRNDAKGLTGSAFEEGKVYEMLLAPDHHTRIIFAINKAPYQELEKNLAEAGLVVIRSQIAPYALLNAFLADPKWKEPNEETLVLATIISQSHVIVTEFDGERFSPEIFRATPLFLEKETGSPEFIDQVRNFFTNCAESAVMAKRVFGKRVVFRWVASGNPAEATLDLGGYLQDRSDIAFEKWPLAQPNIDFKALIEK